MQEVYAIGMKLSLTGNIGPEAKALSETFGVLRDLLKECQASLNGMAGAAAKFKTASSGIAEQWQKTARAMQEAAAAGGRMAEQRYPAQPVASPSARVGPVPLAIPVGPVASGGGQFGPRALPSIPFALPAPSGGTLALAGPGGSGGGFGSPLGSPYPYIPLNIPPSGFGGGGGGNNGSRPSPFGNQPQGPMFSQGSMQSAATEGAVYTFAGYELLKSIADPVMRMGATKAGMMTQGFDDAGLDAAVKASFDTQKASPGTGALDNLALVSKLMTVLQDTKSATDLMPDFARLGVVLDATGHKGGGDELMSAIRAGEYRGVLSRLNEQTGQEEIDGSALAGFIKAAQTAAIVTHGQVGPSQLYQFLKAGGINAAMVGDQAMFADMLALQMSMGSAGAGKGLQGFGMQFSAGRMSEAAYHLLQDMGIVSKDPAMARKSGLGQFMLLPGAMDQGNLADIRNDPVKFITQDLRPKMQAYLRQNYGAIYNGADEKGKLQQEAALAQQITSRIPGGNFIVEVLRNLPLILRDRAAVDRAGKRDAYGTQVANNPEVAGKTFTASVEALQLSLGNPSMKPAMEALDYLTKDVNAIGDWAKKNPDGSRIALEGVAYGVAAFGFGTVAAGAMALLTSPVAGFAALAVSIMGVAKAISYFDDLIGNKGLNISDGKGGQAGLFDVIGGVVSGKRDFLTGALKAPAPPRPTASTAPVPVVVTNSRDIANGANANAARQLSRPAAGGSAPDTRVDLPSQFGYYGQ